VFLVGHLCTVRFRDYLLILQNHDFQLGYNDWLKKMITSSAGFTPCYLTIKVLKFYSSDLCAVSEKARYRITGS